MESSRIANNWEALVSYLPPDYENLVWEHGVLRSEWPNAKVKDAKTLLRFIFLHAGAGLPLRQTVATIAESGGPKVAQVWLHKRMRKAHSYLADLVSRMVVETHGNRFSWANFPFQMVCLDGSTVSGPGSERDNLRMHTVLGLQDLRVWNIRVTPDAIGETFRHFQWEPGQLVIADRGYCNPPGIFWATVDCGAHVLVRVNRGSLPLYDEKGRSIDVLAWARSLDRCRPMERSVCILDGGPKNRRSMKGRLIGLRLPEKEAREARERVRREEGPEVTSEQLEAAEYILLFTSVSAAELSAVQCIDAYRLRWQVELLFKRWKSICHFDRLPNYRDDTMCAWLTAKVLLALLLEKAASVSGPGDSKAPSPERSPLSRQPWKLASIMWPLIVAALLPLELADAHRHIHGISECLDNFRDFKSPRQVDDFFEIHGTRKGPAAN